MRGVRVDNGVEANSGSNKVDVGVGYVLASDRNRTEKVR